jgi:hypothetical protein
MRNSATGSALSSRLRCPTSVRWFLSFLVVALEAQSQISENPDLLLQRIRNRMAVHLSQLSNYTCHEVIDRLVRPGNSGRFEHLDRLELEVAFVGNEELFSRPGEARFQEQEIRNIVTAGTIGNGAFGSTLETVLSGDEAALLYIGPSKTDGHKTFRYDFNVPQVKSHFLVRHDSAEGIVGYKGSFWVDTETLDLVRVELKTDGIPPYIGVNAVQESMHYKIMPIGKSEFILPRNSQLSTVDYSGNYSLNMISLEHCREFNGESVVTYDGPAQGASADRKAPQHSESDAHPESR